MIDNVFTMTTIGSGGPRIVSTQATQSTQSTQQTKSAATAQPAAQGFGTSSTFSAATGGSGSIAGTMSDARAVLDKTDGGGELSKLLQKQIPQRKDLDKAIEEYDKIAESLSPEDRKTVEKALSFQMMGRTLSDNIQKNFEKLLAQIKENGNS